MSVRPTNGSANGIGLLEGVGELSHRFCVAYGEIEEAAGVEYIVSPKLNHVFRRLYGRGKSVVNPCLAVYCRKNNLGYSRLGPAVGVKLGKAMVCNRTRRRIKEVYRTHEGAFFPGYDTVVVARVWAARSRYRKLEHSLLSLADKLGLLRKEGV